jgi:hypothetical protein
MRAAREGWIDNESWRKFDIKNRTVLEVSYEWFVIGGSMSAGVEKNLIQNISKIKFPSLYPMDNWLVDYMDIEWVDSIEIEKESNVNTLDPALVMDEIGTGYFNSIKKVSWKKINMHRTKAKYIVTDIALKLNLRKYATAVGTPEYLETIIASFRPLGYQQAHETRPTSPDRDRDPFEEFYRRIQIGELSDSTMNRTVEFYEYYISLGEFY